MASCGPLAHNGTVTTGRDRTRSCRQRQKRGRAVLSVEVDEFKLISALIESGRLSEAQALDPARVRGALAEVVRDWAGRWSAAL